MLGWDLLQASFITIRSGTSSWNPHHRRSFNFIAWSWSASILTLSYFWNLSIWCHQWLLLMWQISRVVILFGRVLHKSSVWIFWVGYPILLVDIRSHLCWSHLFWCELDLSFFRHWALMPFRLCLWLLIQIFRCMWSRWWTLLFGALYKF